MSDCSRCTAHLETPLGCGGCGVVLDPVDEPGPFQIFGIDPTGEVDPAELKRRLRRFSRIVHPDFHSADQGQRLRAERASARLNHAYKVLLDPFLRADWIVHRLDGPSEKEERQMPQAFLMEVLEWNEALEEAAAAPKRPETLAQLDQLQRSLHDEHDRILLEVDAALRPLPERGSSKLREIRRQLNAVRYLSRALYRIRELRYGLPTT